MESAYLNFLKNLRETETEPELAEGEFPRALRLFRTSSTADGTLDEKSGDKKEKLDSSLTLRMIVKRSCPK